MPYLEKTIRCGDYVHVQRYYAWHTGRRVPRQKDERESAADQKRRNGRHARFRLQCLLQTNFPEGTFLTLTHGEAAPIDEETAKKRYSRYIEALRKHRNRQGKELKYIVIHECQGGRWHHHLITNETSLDAVAALWPHGRATASRLDPSQQYADLAAYLVRDEKPPKGQPGAENVKEPRRKHSRRWSGSRNLEQPEVAVREIRRPGILKQYPRARKGYRLLPDWTCGCDVLGNIWQHYTCVRVAATGSGAKKGGGGHEKDMVQNDTGGHTAQARGGGKGRRAGGAGIQ